MKTTKSQKKAIPDNKSSSSIQKFFKTVGNNSVECKTPKNVKSFYVHALVDKLKSFDDEADSNNDENSGRENVVIASTPEIATNHSEKTKSKGCDVCQARVDKTNGCNECEKWRMKCGESEQWRIKYKEMEKSYLKVCVRYTELKMKHKDLVLVSTGAVRPITETEDIDEVSPTLPVSDDVFTENEIKCLQCVPLDKKKDSTFILNCIQYAYKHNAASLTKKTLKGTRARYEIVDGDAVTVKPGKEPLTPEKVARIKQLFIDRVTKSKCMSGEFGERVKQTNINQLKQRSI